MFPVCPLCYFIVISMDPVSEITDDDDDEKSVNILRICKSTTVVRILLFIPRLLVAIDLCYKSQYTCEICLQIKPNLDVSLTLDTGESESK